MNIRDDGSVCSLNAIAHNENEWSQLPGDKLLHESTCSIAHYKSRASIAAA